MRCYADDVKILLRNQADANFWSDHLTWWSENYYMQFNFTLGKTNIMRVKGIHLKVVINGQ